MVAADLLLDEALDGRSAAVLAVAVPLTLLAVAAFGYSQGRDGEYDHSMGDRLVPLTVGTVMVVFAVWLVATLAILATAELAELFRRWGVATEWAGLTGILILEPLTSSDCDGSCSPPQQSASSGTEGGSNLNAYCARPNREESAEP